MNKDSRFPISDIFEDEFEEIYEEFQEVEDSVISVDEDLAAMSVNYYIGPKPLLVTQATDIDKDTIERLK